MTKNRENATFNKDKGTFINEKIIRIGGEKGFNITKVDPGVIWSYDKVNKLLTLDGTGSITLTGKGKETPIDCGIQITRKKSDVKLTIKDLYIKTDKPLTFTSEDGLPNDPDQSLILEGINILESDAATSTSAVSLKRKMVISGGGSLTVRGSLNGGAGIDCGAYGLVIGDAVFRAEGRKDDAYGIKCGQYALEFGENAFVVVIGGKEIGNANGITQANDSIKHDKGLFICGRLDTDGSFSQNYISELKGSINLHVDAEIPTGGSITVNEGEEFTISDNVTLTNNGRIMNRGNISSERVIVNPPEHFVTFYSNYKNYEESIEQYVKHGSEPILDEFSPREGLYIRRLVRRP